MGYNILMAAAMMSLVPPPQRTFVFSPNDFGTPLNTGYYFGTANGVAEVSKPFDLRQGEVLSGSFTAYRIWNDSGRFVDFPSSFIMNFALFRGGCGTCGMNQYESLGNQGLLGIWGDPPYTLAGHRVPVDGMFVLQPAAIIVPTPMGPLNWSVKVSGTLTATSPSPYGPWEIPLALVGITTAAAPGIWLLWNRVRQRSRGVILEHEG